MKCRESHYYWATKRTEKAAAEPTAVANEAPADKSAPAAVVAKDLIDTGTSKEF
jgi:hypothetical protein